MGNAREKCLTNSKVTKWKARLNVDESKQILGENYWKTYAPVASWSSIRLLLCMAAQQEWKTKKLDFVQAYPQATCETEMYIDIPKGCKINKEDNNKWALKLINNIYGQKQAGRVWNNYLIEELTKQVGFHQSKYDPCILWKGEVIIVIYTDDTIVTGPNDKQVDEEIERIGKYFKITHDHQVSYFLGVNVNSNEDTK